MTDTRASKRQRELLQFVDNFIQGHGYGPSYREIMRSLGYKSVSTVATHIDNLIAKGYVRKTNNSARSLEVVSTKMSESTPTSEIKTDLERQLVAKIELRLQADVPDVAGLEHLVESLRILGYESYDRLRETLDDTMKAT